MGASHLIFRNAQVLRDNMTDAEILLWGYLKENNLGLKFRRQHPISLYIADFYCHKLKLIIELDGSIHNRPDVAANDLERQLYLENQGIKSPTVCQRTRT